MRYLLLALPLLLTTCTEPASAPEKETPATNTVAMTSPPPELTLEQADRLADLPLACIQHEYPNKLGQTIGSKDALGLALNHILRCRRRRYTRPSYSSLP